MPTLVLLRHGQSSWNLEKRFTGWTDVALTEAGKAEARRAGELLGQLELDLVHTSVLARSVHTADLALAQAGRSWLPVRRHWRLNERHYGALQGLSHAEMEQAHSSEQVHTWRRSYDVAPPLLDLDDPRHPVHDYRYRHLPADALPAGESLADVVARMMPYWQDFLAAELASGRTVLVVAHGNSLRALIKHLEGISDEDVGALEIPTGVPRLYQLDGHLRPTMARYLTEPSPDR